MCLRYYSKMQCFELKTKLPFSFGQGMNCSHTLTSSAKLIIMEQCQVRAHLYFSLSTFTFKRK